MVNSTAAYQYSHPEDDQQTMIRWVTGVMIVLATISMVGRYASRKMKNIALSVEDYAMFGGWAVFIIYQAFMYNVITYGFGKHTVFVTDVKGFTIALLCLEVTYNPSIICIKGSILVLYNRLFPDRRLKIFSWALWIFVCAYSIAQFFCELFSCYPIASNWDGKPGKCIDLATVVVVCSIINIVTDLIILSLPMPFLLRLQMDTTRKIQLMSIFLLGGFVCFVSIYRATLVHTVSLLDPAWSDINGALWSGIELSVAIISGNLPVMRPLYNKIFSHHDTDNSGGTGKSNSNNKSPLSMSYPKLRPGTHAHETMVSHGGFERLGASVDQVSVELEPLKKGEKHRDILVTTNVDQEIEVDKKSF